MRLLLDVAMPSARRAPMPPPPRWVRSDQPYIVAVNQLRCPVMWISEERLLEACGLTLGRIVRLEELLDPQRLLREIEERCGPFWEAP